MNSGGIMKSVWHVVLLFAVSLSFLPGMSFADAGDGTLLVNCEIIDNDETAELCKGREREALLWKAGFRRTFYSFETVSAHLSEELEEDYEMILLTNTDEKRHGQSSDFIPPQNMIVLMKGPNNRLFFTRDSSGTINGLQPGTKQLSDIIGKDHRNKITRASSRKYGMPYERNGLELVPVSTGANHHMRSFSGIFQVNWGRSKDRPRRGWSNPMSNPMYLAYFYTNRRGQRERISYAATHGTPKANWKLLGKSRASHGCTRVHPAIMEDIRAVVEDMPLKNVFETNWDYALPTQDVNNPYQMRKPVLIMQFNEYETLAI